MEHVLFGGPGIWEGKGTVSGEQGDVKCEASAVVAVSGNEIKFDISQKFADNAMRKRRYMIKGGGKTSMSAPVEVDVAGTGTFYGAATIMTGSVILTYSMDGTDISCMENIIETGEKEVRIKGSIMNDSDITESWNLQLAKKI